MQNAENKTVALAFKAVMFAAVFGLTLVGSMNAVVNVAHAGENQLPPEEICDVLYENGDHEHDLEEKCEPIVPEPEKPEPKPEVPYAPYCGDGEVNQDFEACDAGQETDSCTVQCQLTNQCVEDIYAAVHVDEAQNWGVGDATTDVYLGSATNKIPSGAWFPLSGVTDPNMSTEGYEDVAGVAVERSVDGVRVLLHGSHSQEEQKNKEHVHGNVEFYGATVLDHVSDATTNNKLEKGFDGSMSLSAGQDEVWFEEGNASDSFFWLTVTSADDGYYTSYTDVEMCVPEPEEFTVVATKVVCEDESLLPNWGSGGGPVIDDQTAINFVEQNEGCYLHEGTKFQYADGSVSNPGDNTGEATEDWVSFGPTNGDGVAEVTLDTSVLNGSDRLWVREVFEVGYVPFSYGVDNSDVSAEIYCHSDVFNYDNYDYITPIEVDQTHYCVAFNAPEKVDPKPDNSCPFEEKDGRIIIDFPDGEKILDHGPKYVGPIEVDVPEGEYNVSLASFDGYENRSSTVQPAEIWKLILKDEGHNVLVTSNVSDDLADDADYVANTTEVGSITIESNASYAKAWHGAPHHNETANSLEPVCAVLDPVVENNKPVIELIGDNPFTVPTGGTYPEPGATASDVEDGDITDDIVIGGDTVDTNTPGTYTVTYNVSDSEGLAADEVTRVVVVADPEPKACSDGADNDGDNLVDADDPGCHTDGDAGNPDSYDPNDDDETHEVPYAPYCGDGLVNQDWEVCDGGDQCTAQCQTANQCVEKSFATVNVLEVTNYTDGDASTDIYLGGALNKIPSGAWFLLYDAGTYVNDADISSYEDVPGLAVQRSEQDVRVVLHGSHPHNGSKEHANGNVEFYNVDVVDVSNDATGNNTLENGFNGVMDNIPSEDEVFISDGNTSQSFFYMTVTTADDGYHTSYGDAPVCEVPNQQPVITLVGDNPLVININETYTDPNATAEDPEDGDITADIVVGGDTVDPNTEGIYTVTYDVVDSEGLAADQVTREVHVVDDSTPPACSDGADNDGDLVADIEDAGCHTDGDPTNPDSYDPNDDSENERPVITLRGDDTITVVVGGVYDEQAADVDDAEDGDIDGNLVIGGDSVDTNTTGTYTVTYDADDSQGLSAEQVTRTVNVVEEGQNQIPVITLIGDSIVEIKKGASYTDQGATAEDAEDGDITDDIVIDETSVDTQNVGSYTVTFNVVDSQGAAAVEVTRTVKVVEDTTTGCTVNCGGGGGGGGGGPIPNQLDIFNEKITVIGQGTALITWNTNKPATSRVVYDDDSHSVSPSVINFGIGSEDLGYEFTTDIDAANKTEHSMLVTNVNLEDLFYFRPISSDGTRAVGIELSAVLGEIDGKVCSQYLFEFIQQGADNNPEEVEKLQRFLNEFEGNNLEITRVYDQATYDAVVSFQNKYGDDVLSPWGLSTDTGYVYLTTRKKINEIYCNFQLDFPLTASQQAEVASFKAVLENLEASGQPLPDTSTVGVAPTTPTAPVLAVADDSEDVEPTVTITDEDASDETEEEANEEQEGDDALASAIEAVDDGEDEGGFFQSIGNFFRGLFR